MKTIASIALIVLCFWLTLAVVTFVFDKMIIFAVIAFILYIINSGKKAKDESPSQE